MNRRPWPRSLAGQLVLVVVAAVSVALAASAVLHLRERGAALSQAGGLQTAQRFAAIVELLDPLEVVERQKIVAILDAGHQRVRLLPREPEPPRLSGLADETRQERFRLLLLRFLGEGRPFRVVVVNVPGAGAELPGGGWGRSRPGGMDPRPGGDVVGGDPVPRQGEWQPGSGPPPWAGMGAGRHGGMHWRMMQGLLPQGVGFLIQARLADGSWVEFRHLLPEELFTWSGQLFALLALLLGVVVGLAWLAVRLVTRPLATLAGAARALGENLDAPPLEEGGAREMREAARAFNAMQGRLREHVAERTRMLAAISHDLRTPLTRMRLRVELLKEEGLREGLLANLREMEALTGAVLDFARGVAGGEEARLVDLPSLLEELEEGYREMGGEVTVSAPPLPPCRLMPVSFRRALTNLVDNAVTYGRRARVEAGAGPAGGVWVAVRDEGPGIPPERLGEVLEPFARLEGSRNRATGGAGLGLAIARNVVAAHGGELTLANRPQGGLEAMIRLPPPR